MFSYNFFTNQEKFRGSIRRFIHQRTLIHFMAEHHLVLNLENEQVSQLHLRHKSSTKVIFRGKVAWGQPGYRFPQKVHKAAWCIDSRLFDYYFNNSWGTTNSFFLKQNRSRNQYHLDLIRINWVFHRSELPFLVYLFVLDWLSKLEVGLLILRERFDDLCIS